MSAASAIRPGIVCLLLFVAAALAAAAAPPDTAWTVFSNCTLLVHGGSDGDSFHVMAGGTERIFRLYFADCPETDMQIPSRVQEQADHWRVGQADVLGAGKKATQFTRRLLRKPFTVHTRMEDARGQSGLPRYYAFVTTAAGDRLHERLVARGLARSHGMHRDLPDGTAWRKHLDRLDALEGEARRKRVGLWAASGDPAGGRRPAADDEPRDILVLQRPVAVYGTNGPSAKQGELPRGSRVYVMRDAAGGMVAVRYRTGGGMAEGRCRGVDLSSAGVKP